MPDSLNWACKPAEHTDVEQRLDSDPRPPLSGRAEMDRAIRNEPLLSP